MEPLNNPIEISPQNPELPKPRVEVPTTPEREEITSESQVQAEVAAEDDPLQAEQAALEKQHDISEAISIPATQDKLTNQLTGSEDELLKQLNKTK
jgi:hypothetical protein